MHNNSRSTIRFFAAAAVLFAAVWLSACSSGGAKVPDTYNYEDFTQYVTLGEYKDLEYTEVDTAVTDEEVQAYIDNAVQAATKDEDITEGEVEKDSVIKVDFTGKIDGEEFDGGTAVNYQINMATDTFIDGFKEGILGHKVGDTFDLNLKFPDGYDNADVAGKDVVFTVTVKALVKSTTPKYDDDFVKSNTEFDNTKDYEASIRSNLEESKKDQAVSTQRSELFGQILDASEVKEYPETELEAAKEDMKSTYTSLAEQSGIEYAEYLETYLGMTEEEFDEQIVTSSENMVKQQLVLRALAQELDIKITDQDYADFLKGLLEDNGFTEESFKDQFGMEIEEYASQNNYYESMLYEKIMDQVIELGKEVPAKDSDEK